MIWFFCLEEAGFGVKEGAYRLRVLRSKGSLGMVSLTLNLVYTEMQMKALVKFACSKKIIGHIE